MFDQRAKPVERHRIAIGHEDDHMRIADIDRCRLFQFLPAGGHGQRIHRKGERDGVPVKARLAHVDGNPCGIGAGGQQPASGGDGGRLAQQQAHGARCIAAGFYLTAILIVDAHAAGGAG